MIPENARRDQPPPIMDLHEAAEFARISESTLKELVRRSEFPQPRKLGGKNLWLRDEIYGFIKALNDRQPEKGTIYDATRRLTGARA